MQGADGLVCIAVWFLLLPMWVSLPMEVPLHHYTSRPDSDPPLSPLLSPLHPQVAAHAEHHLCVRKASGIDKRMLTRFELLQQRPERVAEISAMAGLGPDAAEELLAAAAEA